jgi:hypothetical protein
MKPDHPEMEKFIIFVRDAKEKTLIRGVDVNPRSFDFDGKQRNWEAMGYTDDGTIQIGLGEGRHQLVFQADGYHPLMVQDCVIRTKTPPASLVAVGMWELAYLGDTFTYTVFMERTEGRSPRLRYQQFLSDTTYYSMPQVLPQLIGGEQSLKGQLAPDGLNGTPNVSASVSHVDALVCIEKDGRIGRLEVSGDAPKTVQKKVEQAIRNVRFTPGLILGNPVRSRLYIPFQFALDWKEK